MKCQHCGLDYHDAAGKPVEKFPCVEGKYHQWGPTKKQREEASRVARMRRLFKSDVRVKR